MSEKITVGEVTARFLESSGVTTAYGVISIHNMPILDALGQRGNIRFIASRGEAGAVNMADAHARVENTLGVAFTSTGTAAGNAAGALVEAQTAGTALLHITGQIDTRYLDRNLAYIHEARDQLTMLEAVSKAAFRVRSAETALETLKQAVQTALSAPSGPVSVEIPIDIQQAEIFLPDDFSPLPIAVVDASDADVDTLVEELSGCRRPLLWLGGGARHAGDAVRRLIDLGFGVVSSTQGRGIVPDDHAMNLGAFTMFKPVEKFYASCDALLVVGSRLRGNETLTYRLALPQPLYRIDADPDAEDCEYNVAHRVVGDAADVLTKLADRLTGRLTPDNAFADDLGAARSAAESFVMDGLGPYTRLVDAVCKAAGNDFVWVRDVTISNSTWGNRLPNLQNPRDGVHALGGGIGQGLPMLIGSALAAGGRKVLGLVGDGGLQLNIGEMATAVQERANFVLILMNSQDYGVIRNIQDASYGGRHYFTDILTPEFDKVCASVNMHHTRIDDLADVDAALAAALKINGPAVVEINMAAVGPFACAFAGPPARLET
jgi:acetolactate synthase-1/2/3 large subunit